MVVKLVSECFVPVALNADRLPDTDDGKFFRALLKQWPQGLWVVTPGGKALGFHYHRAKPGESYADGQNRWVTDTVGMLRNAIKEAGPLAPREMKPRPEVLSGRGRAFGKDGEIRPAVSVVGYQNGRRNGPPVVDSLHFDEDRLAEFAPPKDAKAGTNWTVPDMTASLFAPALSPMTDPIFSPTPADVKSANVTAKVERVADGTIVVRYAGRWESTHNRDGDPKYPIRATATGEGVGVFDNRTGTMTEMVWVLTGTYRNGPATEKPRTTAAVIEWTSNP